MAYLFAAACWPQSKLLLSSLQPKIKTQVKRKKPSFMTLWTATLIRTCSVYPPVIISVHNWFLLCEKLDVESLFWAIYNDHFAVSNIFGFKSFFSNLAFATPVLIHKRASGYVSNCFFTYNFSSFSVATKRGKSHHSWRFVTRGF